MRSKRDAIILTVVIIAATLYTGYTILTPNSKTVGSSRLDSPYTVDGDVITFKGGYEVEIKSAEQGVKEVLGENVSVATIKLGFTNNGEETKSFAFALREAAYQDGVELERFYNSELMPADCNTTNDVRPGSSVEVILAYELRNGNEVEFEIGELFSDEDERYIINYSF